MLLGLLLVRLQVPHQLGVGDEGPGAALVGARKRLDVPVGQQVDLQLAGARVRLLAVGLGADPVLLTALRRRARHTVQLDAVTLQDLKFY